MLLFALTKHRVQAGQKHQDRQAVPAALPSCTSVPVNFHHFPAEYKLGKNIKIAMLYLEDEDAVSAEQYIKKASSLLSACKVRGQWGRWVWATALGHSAAAQVLWLAALVQRASTLY